MHNKSNKFAHSGHTP